MWVVRRAGELVQRGGVKRVAFRFDVHQRIRSLRLFRVALPVGISDPLPPGGPFPIRRFGLEERMKKLEEKYSEFHEFRKTTGEKFKKMAEELSGLKAEMENQKSFHREWCNRDIVVVAAEVLKWSVGVRGRNDEKGQFFWSLSCERQVQIGAEVFGRTVSDYQNFSRLVILSRNSEVHLGSLKVLDERVATALKYIQSSRDTGDYLKISRPREVEIIETYEKLKTALPAEFS